MQADSSSTERKDGYFVQLPLEILFHEQLSDGAKVMYGVLQSFDYGLDEAGQRKGYVFPSLRTLSEKSHKSQRRVSEYLRALEEEESDQDGTRRPAQGDQISSGHLMTDGRDEYVHQSDGQIRHSARWHRRSDVSVRRDGRLCQQKYMQEVQQHK